MANKVILTPDGDKYKLEAPFRYKDVEVPKGYSTDGVSYKLRAVGVFINKFDPLYIEAAIVHDYLTDLGDWEKANRYFEEMLPNDWRGKAMVAGVKMYARYKGYL